jgi:peroxiredoxin
MSTVTHAEPQIGETAPDFTLPSTAGGTVTLSSLAGQKNVLLAFFPLAFTSVCTTELCSFWEDVSQFEENDTKVFGVSVDHTASQKAFQEKAGFKTDLLSDFKRTVSRQYGVLIEDSFFSKRAYFLIGKDGKLAWKHVEAALGDRRENAELLDQIRRLKSA